MTAHDFEEESCIVRVSRSRSDKRSVTDLQVTGRIDRRDGQTKSYIFYFIDLAPLDEPSLDGLRYPRGDRMEVVRKLEKRVK